MEEIEAYLCTTNLEYKINKYLDVCSTKEATLYEVLQFQDAIKKFIEKYAEMINEGKANGHYRDCVSSNLYVTTVPDTCMCVSMYMYLSRIKQMYHKVCNVLK